jgi:hypothetical protein
MQTFKTATTASIVLVVLFCTLINLSPSVQAASYSLNLSMYLKITIRTTTTKVVVIIQESKTRERERERDNKTREKHRGGVIVVHHYLCDSLIIVAVL